MVAPTSPDARAAMTPQLSEIEARVIGCLIEKQIATPDQYPLTLNSLIAACNQKSNRDPVLALAEHDVQAALAALTRRDLVLERFVVGDRVAKYQQLFCNTEFGSLRFSPVQTAIVCELLLRGPQTPGELKAHSGRLHEFADSADAEAALESLMTRSDGPFVARLSREPRRKDHAYVHLFGGPIESAPREIRAESAEAPAARPSALATLEARVEKLEQELAALKQTLGVT